MKAVKFVEVSIARERMEAVRALSIFAKKPFWKTLDEVIEVGTLINWPLSAMENVVKATDDARQEGEKFIQRKNRNAKKR